MKIIGFGLVYGFIFWSAVILIINRHDALFYSVSFVVCFGMAFAWFAYKFNKKGKIR